MSEGVSEEASAAAEEAEWALATAENLEAKGDAESARTWFLRAAEYLMDAGLDDRALEVAKRAAALALPSVAPAATPAAPVAPPVPQPQPEPEPERISLSEVASVPPEAPPAAPAPAAPPPAAPEPEPERVSLSDIESVPPPPALPAELLPTGAAAAVSAAREVEAVDAGTSPDETLVGARAPMRFKEHHTLPGLAAVVLPPPPPPPSAPPSAPSVDEPSIIVRPSVELDPESLAAAKALAEPADDAREGVVEALPRSQRGVEAGRSETAAPEALSASTHEAQPAPVEAVSAAPALVATLTTTEEADKTAPETAPEAAPETAPETATGPETLPAARFDDAGVAAALRPPAVPKPEGGRVPLPGGRGVPPPAPRTPRASIPLPKSVAPRGDEDAVGAAPAVTARASVRPPSQPPRSALVWQPARALAAEQLSARLLVLPLFQEIDPEARRRYAREASMLTFRAGEVMVAAPEPGERAVESALLVLTEGTAVTAVPGDDVPIALLGPGDVAGELGALHGGIPVAETVARTEVKAVSFAPSLVRAMARSHGSVRQSLDETAWERAFASLGRGARLLRRIEAAERAKVFSWFEPVEIEEGALLLSEGAAPSALWLLAAGEVEVYGGALEGIWRARAGEALGLVALLDDAAAGVTARAVRRALAAKLPASKFKEMLKHHPSLAGARDDLGVVC